MFVFAPPRRSRRPSLTPMIDVVFLLLVFFMLASQFASVRLSGAGAGDIYSGPPRLVDISADTLALNGKMLALPRLVEALAPLTTTRDDTVVLRGADGASVQRLLDVAQVLERAGFAKLVVVE